MEPSDKPQQNDQPTEEQLFDAVVGLLPPLLTGLDVLAKAGRHLHPPDIQDLIESVAPFRAPLAEQLAPFVALRWPEHLRSFEVSLKDAANNVLKGLAGFVESGQHSNAVMAAYGALRYQTRALEALYPVTAMLPPVSRFFLDADHQNDEALLERLAAPREPGFDTGVLHAANGTTERGGFSVYVPEYAQPGVPMPLIVAMHGGSGHGRAFLWTWLREARSSGAILIAPTSVDRTWSLMGTDEDTPNLMRMLEFVSSRYAIDADHLLLTGMSDGGTFSYVSGLQENSPFTHLAPVSASFHPLLLETSSAARLSGLPVFITHGALDWMFPVDMAAMAAQSFQAVGAAVRFEAIEDLSHTYPAEMNTTIMRWFLD
jgi:phospholipase/carboxylesterase